VCGDATGLHSSSSILTSTWLPCPATVAIIRYLALHPGSHAHVIERNIKENPKVVQIQKGLHKRSILEILEKLVDLGLVSKAFSIKEETWTLLTMNELQAAIPLAVSCLP
jgi:hypothetical protein